MDDEHDLKNILSLVMDLFSISLQKKKIDNVLGGIARIRAAR